VFSRPTLQQLIDRIRNDLLARLSLDDPLRRSDAEAYARVHSGAVHGLYGYLSWIADQVMVDTAGAEYLERHASIWGVTRKAASFASGTATFGTQIGAVIPAGTVVQAFDGVEYAVTVGGTATGTTLALAIQAVTAGAAGNRTTGQTLTMTSPVAGVQSDATASEISGGADTETDTALRARVLARIQQPPHGGAEADYVAWALEIEGVTRAWVYPLELGAGTVTVRFVRDDDASPIPDAAEVAAVQAHLDPLRPVTAALTVVAPVAVPLNLTIALTPGTAAVKDAVTAELADLLRREATPGGTILISHLREAISLAAGETDHVLTVPAADVTHTTGQLATLGTITWA
jgi:uncharacterized phage protein gp47/JayE